MLKLSKRVDYGLIALRHLALQDSNSSAKEIAARYGIPVPLMSKVLQSLARSGLLASEHGTNGGYRLARAPGMISALEAIRAIEGPIALADCFGEDGSCDRSARCTVRRPLRKVHEGILSLLDSITILELSEAGPPDGLFRLDAGVPALTRS